MWRWISSWQPEVKIHSIVAQERRQCSAEWDLKSIFVHYNTFSKLLHILKKNEGAAVELFKPQWNLKLFGFCLCTISSIALLVSHQQTCKPKSCYKNQVAFHLQALIITNSIWSWQTSLPSISQIRQQTEEKQLSWNHREMIPEPKMWFTFYAFINWAVAVPSWWVSPSMKSANTLNHSS